MENTKTQIYESSFLLLPTIAEENLMSKYSDLKNALEKVGAVLVSEEIPKMRALAYTFFQNNSGKNTKFNFAYFAWLKYELTTDKAGEVKEILEQNKDILRFLTIKTVRENTLSGYKFNKKEEKTVAEDRKDEVLKENKVEDNKAEVDEVEVDQKIDELVA